MASGKPQPDGLEVSRVSTVNSVYRLLIEDIDRLGTISSSLTGESVVGIFNPLSYAYVSEKK